MQAPNHVYIYVLELTEGKFYVGKSTKLVNRIQDHFSGNGCYWTSLYPVIGVIETIQGDSFDEDKYVKKYMAKYGIDNVRGGSYSRRALTPDEEALLKKELLGASDACFRCGRNNHFVSNCYAKTHLDGHKLASRRRLSRTQRESKHESESSDEEQEEVVDGTVVQPQVEVAIVETPKPVQVETPTPEPIKTQNKTVMPKPCLSCRGDHDILDCPQKGDICYRCGSREHWKITCTATRDVNGYPLEFDVIGHIGSAFKSWFG
jgi:predicted GIY-YIG superfamily endonuclease